MTPLETEANPSISVHRFDEAGQEIAMVVGLQRCEPSLPVAAIFGD